MSANPPPPIELPPTDPKDLPDAPQSAPLLPVSDKDASSGDAEGLVRPPLASTQYVRVCRILSSLVLLIPDIGLTHQPWRAAMQVPCDSINDNLAFKGKSRWDIAHIGRDSKLAINTNV